MWKELHALKILIDVKQNLEFIRQFAIINLQVKQLPPPGFFEYWLEDGKALILLNGLDEVASPGRRYEIVNRIECFL